MKDKMNPKGNITQTLGEILSRLDSASQWWSCCPVKMRSRSIEKLRWVIVGKQEEIMQTIAEETGKPITEVANQEVTAALEMLRYSEKAYPRWLREHRFRYWRPGFWTKLNSIHFVPLGVVAVIGPSNFPFSLPVMQTCAALLCGNCVVVKPSDRCPQTTHLIQQIFNESEFPEGVVEVVEGAAEIAEQLIAHESVRKVIFTGSYHTGKRVAQICGRYFKPCILELGGNSAAIVCDDADVSLAAKGITWSAFYANGLSCVGTKRVFVHASVGRQFVQELFKQIKAIKIGDPLEPTTEMGKMKSGRDVPQLRELVQDAITNGAIIWTSEREIGTPPSIDFGKPIVLLNASPSMRVMNEEIGAPLVAICEIHSTGQAIREANASPYGLGASVWSKRTAKAQAIARQLNVGMVWINDSSVGLPKFPWGGVKQSGWGRTFSQESVSELTNVKVISHDRRRISLPKFWWFPYSEKKFEIFLSINRFLFARKTVKTLGRFVALMMQSIKHSKA